ncbi:MAG: response regulator, partial [Prevotellaceae bacterium]|nr:response regulator [Prevotellaceae bacterium]
VLTTNIEPTLDKAYFDRDKLDKIIYNLLSNAVKYNKEGGRIMVALENHGGKARIVVEDEGIGISKSNLKKLYTRFLDGDYRKLNTTGTGIGISLTRDLTELHHGTIDCQSHVGEGTRFTIDIPVKREAYREEEIAEKTTDEITIENISATLPQTILAGGETADDTDSKDYTMLIVEDNTELLEMMARLLRKKYNVATARNGQQAWYIIQRQELDIVITDVMMPVMDGIELTRVIKQSADYGQLPVVMLTAKTNDKDRNVAFEAGADEYIIKPFSINDLCLRVDNIIANRRRIRDRFSSQTEYEVAEQHYSNPDEVFIKRAIECVKAHIDDYDRESFARDMCLSSSSLYNKLRAITGQNISNFITSVRLKEACRIARQDPNIKVMELGMRVGFSTPKYFTKVFKEEFGMSPSEYLEKLKEK